MPSSLFTFQGPSGTRLRVLLYQTEMMFVGLDLLRALGKVNAGPYYSRLGKDVQTRVPRAVLREAGVELGDAGATVVLLSEEGAYRALARNPGRAAARIRAVIEREVLPTVRADPAWAEAQKAKERLADLEELPEDFYDRPSSATRDELVENIERLNTEIEDRVRERAVWIGRLDAIDRGAPADFYRVDHYVSDVLHLALSDTDRRRVARAARQVSKDEGGEIFRDGRRTLYPRETLDQALRRVGLLSD